jgi:hypothetical protein
MRRTKEGGVFFSLSIFYFLFSIFDLLFAIFHQSFFAICLILGSTNCFKCK